MGKDVLSQRREQPNHGCSAETLTTPVMTNPAMTRAVEAKKLVAKSDGPRRWRRTTEGLVSKMKAFDSGLGEKKKKKKKKRNSGLRPMKAGLGNSEGEKRRSVNLDYEGGRPRSTAWLDVAPPVGLSERTSRLQTGTDSHAPTRIVVERRHRSKLTPAQITSASSPGRLLAPLLDLFTSSGVGPPCRCAGKTDLHSPQPKGRPPLLLLLPKLLYD